jgi:hypothetical protein
MAMNSIQVAKKESKLTINHIVETPVPKQDLTRDDQKSAGLALGLIIKSGSPRSIAVATGEFLEQFFSSLNKILSEKQNRANNILKDQPKNLFIPFNL